MVKKDRVTSAVNLGNKASLREIAASPGNKFYGSQEVIYPAGQNRLPQPAMQIEHAEFNLQRQFESSNSAVNIIDDVDSSSQTKQLANQLVSK